MLEQLGTFATVVGLFHLFNELALDTHKRTLAAYLFGARDVSFAGFEQSAIRSFLTPFMHDGKLRWRRVVILSLSVSFVLSVYFSIAFFAQVVGADVRFSEVVPMFVGVLIVCALFSALLSLPFDWATLRVAQYLFLDRSFSVRLLAPLILAVAVIALVPPSVQFFLATYADRQVEFAGVGYQFLITGAMAAALMNGITSILVTALQVTVLIVGVLSRAIILVLNIGPMLARYSKVQTYPVTFVGIIVGLGIVIAQL